MISCLTGKGNLEQLLFVLPACCNFFDLRIYSWARIDFIESLSFHSSHLLFLVAECCDVNTLRSLLCLFFPPPKVVIARELRLASWVCFCFFLAGHVRCDLSTKHRSCGSLQVLLLCVAAVFSFFR